MRTPNSTPRASEGPAPAGWALTITVLTLLPFLALLSACSDPASSGPESGKSCTEDQFGGMTCGVNLGGDAVVLQCRNVEGELIWAATELCSLGCQDAKCLLPDIFTPPKDLTENLSTTPDLPGDVPAEIPVELDAVPDTFCQPGHPICMDQNTRGICNDLGADYYSVPCDPGLLCDDGYCLELLCTPGELKDECVGPSSAYVCNEMGTAWDTMYCEEGLTCYQGQCVNWQCNPGDKMCKGLTAIQECLPDAEGVYVWTEVEVCEGGLCKEGVCIGACDADLKMNTYLGCGYWAVDLDNIETGQFEEVAIVVSAPTTNTLPADVSITSTKTGQLLTSAQLGGSPLVVQPGGLQVYTLPAGNDIDGSMLTDRSFGIETTQPVTIHQFNPLNGDNVFTNDASLLLPSHAGGEEYVVMSWPMRTWSSTLRGFATVIATQEGQTNVTVQPASAVLQGQGVSPIPKNGTKSFVLNQGEVLNLETEGSEGADLTGTIITASQKVNVFGGHECANIQIPWERCDHIEQQLYPLQAWGTHYIGDPFEPRNQHHEDTWRIVAGANNVTVTLDPPVAGPYTMNKGQWVEFDTQQVFQATGTGKFLVGHYLQSCNYPGYTVFCTDSAGQLGIGDPAFTLAVPVGQYLEGYVFLTPEDYAEDYVNIIYEEGTELQLDGQVITPASETIGFSDWRLARIEVFPGVHTINASQPVGATVYGYGCHVSYAYPGGLKLEAF